MHIHPAARMIKRLSWVLCLSLVLGCGEGDEKDPTDPEEGPTLDVDDYGRLKTARFDPAGTRVAMFAQVDGLVFDLITTDVQGKDVHVLVSDAITTSNLAWSEDGEWVFYRGDWEGDTFGNAILRMKADGSGEPELVTLKDGAYLDVSSDGSTLVFGGSIFTIWVAPLDVLPIPDESLFETTLKCATPRLSPDGSKLLCQNTESAPEDKFRYIIASTDTWKKIKTGPSGSNFIGSAAWINDDEFVYDSDDGIRRSDGSGSELVQESPTQAVDANPATQTYLYSEMSGSAEIWIKEL